MKTEQSKENFEYFQYFKELGFPIYVRFNPLHFDASLSIHLLGHKFSKIDDKDKVRIEENLLLKRDMTILTIKEATPTVARFIEAGADSDLYGRESITPKQGYKLYRYKNLAVLLYSFSFSGWELGCFNDFGHEHQSEACRLVINRFLSLALSMHKVIGFFGVQVDEGVVVQSPRDSHYEVVYFDMEKGRIFSSDGIKPIRSRFQIIKLDSSLRNQNIAMTGEELLGYLYRQCSFFDYSGLTVPTRQLIMDISKKVRGILHPKESFKPKSNLSL
jgi:hypothetical protein